MSKVSLRRELARFDSAQLREIILDLYSSRKEAKDYLEFFLDPDVEALKARFFKEIAKELARVKRRESAARWSRIRASVKNFASFNPGESHVAAVMAWTFGVGVDVLNNRNVTSTFINGLARMLGDTLSYGDKNSVLGEVLPAMLDSIKTIDRRYRDSREAAEALDAVLELHNIHSE